MNSVEKAASLIPDDFGSEYWNMYTLAPNPVIFMESPDYLGTGRLTPTQFKIVCDFFNLRCPKCSPPSTDDSPQDYYTLFHYGKCPKCGHRNDNTGARRFTGIHATQDKQEVIPKIAAYLVHKFLCIDNIRLLLDFTLGTTLEAAIVADHQTWNSLMYLLESSKWFRGYGNKIEHPKFSHNQVKFNKKNFTIRKYTQNSTSLAGKTRVFAVIGDLTFSDSDVRTENELYTVLARSLTAYSAGTCSGKRTSPELPNAAIITLGCSGYTNEEKEQLISKTEEDREYYIVSRDVFKQPIQK